LVGSSVLMRGDSIYDPVGMIVPSLKCIAWCGRAIVVGFAGGNIEKVRATRLVPEACTDAGLQIPANLILLKNIAITGVHWVRRNRLAVVPLADDPNLE
jgi:NADPH2:quinone reductase